MLLFANNTEMDPKLRDTFSNKKRISRRRKKLLAKLLLRLRPGQGKRLRIGEQRRLKVNARAAREKAITEEAGRDKAREESANDHVFLQQQKRNATADLLWFALLLLWWDPQTLIRKQVPGPLIL